MNENKTRPSGNKTEVPPEWNQTFQLWKNLAGKDKRFFQVLSESRFWQLGFPERLALVSWGAFAASLFFYPFVYYFIKRMHYKGATILSCWFLALAAFNFADAHPPGILVSPILAIFLSHLATYDYYRHITFKETVWPWVPEFLRTQTGAILSAASSCVCFCLSLSGSDSTAPYARTSSNAEDSFSILFMIAIAIVIVAFFFLPAIIAFKRAHPNRWAIFVINLCFGSTGIGWLGALIWAMHKVHDPGDGKSAGGESGLNLFVNDTKIVELKEPLQGRGAPGGNPSISDLEKLANLFERGLLSEQEYNSQKARILQELRPE